jgi:hypothetical protein
MIRRLSALQSAVSAAFIRTWPWLPEKLNDFLGSFVITLPVCWISYAFGFSAVRCIGMAIDCAEIGTKCAELKVAGGCLILLFLSPLLLALPPIIHDEGEPVSTYGIEAVLVALALALTWTAIRIRKRVVGSRPSTNNRNSA